MIDFAIRYARIPFVVGETMKNKTIVVISFIFVSAVSFDVARAAGQTFETKETAQRGSDAKADEALGVLTEKKPKKTKSAAKEALEKLKAQNQAEDAIREAEKRQAEEERKRLQHSIIEDKKIGQ